MPVRPPPTRLLRRGLLGVVIVVAGAVAFTLRRTPAPAADPARGPSAVAEGTSIGDLSFFRFHGGEQKVQVKARAGSGEENGVMRLEGVEVRFPFTARGEESTATVTADECLYDASRESAQFHGNVHVVTDDGFELDTEELAYDGGKGRVKSDTDVAFRRGLASGNARGMVYRTEEGELQLGPDVRLRFDEAEGGPPTQVSADRARASQKTRVIRFQGNVVVDQVSRSLRSRRLQLTLDPELQSIVRAVAIGAVDARLSAAGALRGEMASGGGERRLRCRRLDVDFRAPGVFEKALASRNASLELLPGKGEPPEKRTVEARTLQFLFDEQGRLEALRGRVGGGSTRSATSAAREARRAARAASAARKAEPGAAAPRGGKAPRGRGKERAPRASARKGDAPVAGETARVVLTSEPISPAKGEKRRVECLRFQALIEPETGALRSGELEESVRFVEGARRAWSERAVYDAPGGSLTLTEGGPRIHDEAEGSELQAETIRLDTAGGGIEAVGGVRHTLAPRGGRAEGALLGGAAETLVVSGRLDYDPDTRSARYSENVLLRSGTDEIRAALLVLDEAVSGQRHLLASGGTSSLLHPRRGKKPGRDPAPVKTRSREMVYDEMTGRVEYTGDVEIRQGDILTLSPTAVVTLTPGGDDVERLVAGEPVEVRQGPKRATGRTGTYTLADETLVLVGDEVVLQDAETKVKGRALTFKVGEDRIRIDGREEVRTEAVFQKKDTPQP